MKINLVLVFVMIFLNAIFLNASELDEQSKMDFLNSLSNQQSQDFFDIYQKFINGSEAFDKNEWLQKIIIISQNNEFWKQNLIGNELLIQLKLRYAFGPSLFASLLLVIVQAYTVDWFFPRNKILTLLIYTTNSSTMSRMLKSIGYQNSIAVGPTTFIKDNQKIKKQCLTITIGFLNLKKIQESISNLEKDAEVKILKTEKVEGFFSYRLLNLEKEKLINQEMLKNKQKITKLQQEAIYKTYKKFLKN